MHGSSLSQARLLRIEAAYRERFPKSQRLYARGKLAVPQRRDARRPLPAAVSDLHRRAPGSRKWDVDGNEIIDYWAGHGALLLGHSHPAVVEAVREQAAVSTHPGACHELELEWAEMGPAAGSVARADAVH